jgi:hypothetical protein
MEGERQRSREARELDQSIVGLFICSHCE